MRRCAGGSWRGRLLFLTDYFMNSMLLLASAVYNSDEGNRVRCRDWVDSQIAEGGRCAPEAGVVRALLRREHGTPLEPFSLDERQEELAVLLVRLAFARRGKLAPVVIGSGRVTLAASGLEIRPDLTVRYHHFWDGATALEDHIREDPWRHAWRFRAGQGLGEGREQGVPVSARLVGDVSGVRVTVRLGMGIPVAGMPQWKVSLGQMRDVERLGIRIRRLRADTFAVWPGSPEAALRFMACLMERDELTVHEAEWTVRVQLAPPGPEPVALSALITSPAWQDLPWLEAPAGRRGIREEPWMREALRSYLPQSAERRHSPVFSS